MEDKKTKLLKYFEEERIEVPENIKVAINDVFEENDNIDFIDIDNDPQEFKENFEIRSLIYVDIGKDSELESIETYTYTDNPYPIKSIKNRIFVKEEDAVIDVIKDEDLTSQTGFGKFDPREWCIVLLERKELKNREYKITLELKIYYPEK